MKTVATLVVLSSSIGLSGAAALVPRIQVIPRDLAPRVDVLVQGRPYTTYLYQRSLPRPGLDPVHAASGAAVAREALWFAHADVNGIDFSSDRHVTANRGRIVPRRIIETVSGGDEGQLGVEMTWMAPGDVLAMVEDARFLFRERQGVRSIDRLTRLSAVRGDVRLARNGKGVTGVRLAADLAGARAVFLGPDGSIDRGHVSGARRPWLAVEGFAGPERITVALMDHPRNPGFPNAWRLDDPGVLAIAPASDVGIDAGRSATFRHRLVVFPGHATPAAIQSEFQDFSAPRRSPAPASAAPPRTDRLSQGS